MTKSNNIYFFPISLGCVKNQVDLEYLTHELYSFNWIPVHDPEDCDVIIINTCAFINDAKEESINMIFEMIPHKPVIVTGCLSQLFKEKLKTLIPEVNIFAGTESAIFAEQMNDAFRANKRIVMINPNHHIYREFKCRTPYNRYHAYIKISEGCDRQCSYCIIPDIRGQFRSRNEEDIIREIEELYKMGIREFEIVSEDTSLYGVDTGGRNLQSLLSSLDNLNLNNINFRLLYLYPDEHIRGIADFIADSKHFIRYLDVPFQHTSSTVLKNMQRVNINVREISAYIRERGIILRTSLMCGFPGETKNDYLDMKNYIENDYADRLGLFAYSGEDGAHSSQMKEQISNNSKSARLRELQKTVDLSMQRKMQLNLNAVKTAVFYYQDKGLYVGRLTEDMPDIDFECVSDNIMPLYECVNVKIIGCMDYIYTVERI